MRLKPNDQFNHRKAVKKILSSLLDLSVKEGAITAQYSALLHCDRRKVDWKTINMAIKVRFPKRLNQIKGNAWYLAGRRVTNKENQTNA